MDYIEKEKGKTNGMGKILLGCRQKFSYAAMSQENQQHPEVGKY